jgi:Exo-beta-D-glucosaminidase Ig-fold domain
MRRMTSLAGVTLSARALLPPIAASVPLPAATAAPPTGSSAITDLGSAGWKVLTNATATQSGAQISTHGFSTSGWLSVTNDGAGAPGTEINALLQNGSCPNAFFSTNMKTCFGQMTKVGADTIAQFSVPWWYRTDFAAPPAGQDATLILGGGVGKADVWVSGAEIATSATVAGAYTRYQTGPNGADRLTTVTVTNTSTTPAVGFFLRADIRRGTASGTELSGDNQLQSGIWTRNDITLWPGDSQSITVTWQSADLQGATPVVSLSGWNVPKFDIVGG